MKRKFVMLFLFVLLLTGCTKLDGNVDTIISSTIRNDINYVNKASTNYELYLPLGVIQLSDSEYNQKFKIRNTFAYLYVDTVSYYYKYDDNYHESNSEKYYFKKLNNGNKNGFVEIFKLDGGNYFCNIVYNYSKMEFYADEEHLDSVLASSLIIINSIKYNDSLIEMELNTLVNNSHELKYELDKPKESESTFDQFLQEYIEKENTSVELPSDE